MARLLIVLLVVLALVGFVYWFKRTPAPRVARTLRRVAFWGLIGALALAAATGRLNPIFALLGALVPAVVRLAQLAQLLPAIQRALRSLGIALPGGIFGPFGANPGTAGGTAGTGTRSDGPQVSAIRTRFLAMRLDHASGAMDGEVLAGPFAGRQLGALDLDALLRMLELYRESDGQSASLLETYLDRERGDHWRSRDPGTAGPGAGPGPAASVGGPMSEAEACSILGLKPGADVGAVRAAHRRLMQKLHPDRGGSDYLAAKINEAKQVLLRGRE